MPKSESGQNMVARFGTLDLKENGILTGASGIGKAYLAKTLGPIFAILKIQQGDDYAADLFSF